MTRGPLGTQLITETHSLTYGHVVLSLPRLQSGQRAGVQQQPVVFLCHKLQWKMAIKARPYGGKPGIAVAKETKSGLLTVWPIKLWGAVAPVAAWRRERVRKIQVEHGGKKQSLSFIHLFFSFFFHFCARWNLLDLCAWRVLLGRKRDILVDSHRQRVFVQGHAEKKRLINQLFALAVKPLNIQLYFKSISYEHNITPAYSLSITAARAQPSGDCYGSAHHISFVRR